jgi:Mn2+/Fe2+ NRAMP family transporter
VNRFVIKIAVQEPLMKPKALFRAIGPGVLVAATGVGAGDLATASLAGAALGLAALWAVPVGALLKFLVNEGLTRWQLATGTTLVEGCVAHLGRGVMWGFLAYLVVWSFCVAAALMSAIGVTMHAILPLAGEGVEAAQRDKATYGVLFSLATIVLVRLGGYRLFEKVMAATIAVMFVTVVATAIALEPPWFEVLHGLTWPTIPPGGAAWTIAIIGGIGGTVTVLCYGYWIREEGRTGVENLPLCRLDLAVGYAMTAVFGVAMIIVGNSLGPMEGGGATLVVKIAARLEEVLGAAGPVFKWAFLAGAWGAVFSSMLGVWQSVPYLFADLWQLARGGAPGTKVDTRSPPYQAYLVAIGIVPILGLVAFNFQSMQKVYAVVGAFFIPMLAAVLLVLNGRRDLVGEANRNRWWTVVALVGALVFFVLASAIEIRDTILG